MNPKIDEERLEKTTIVLMKGLPYSGKSTAIMNLMHDDVDGLWHSAAIVSPDAIRVAMHGQRFLPRAEALVWATARIMTRALALVGHTIIFVDATGNTLTHRDEWRKYGDGWNVQIWEIPTSREECIRRATSVGDTDILPIIRNMDDLSEDLKEHEKRFVL